MTGRLNTPRSYAVLLVFEFACLVVLSFLRVDAFRNQTQAHDRVTTASDLHHTSLVLADQLRQSSDDLTRMVRTYAATGESRFEDYFYEILAIRDGIAPRPEQYDLIFWDFRVAERRSGISEVGVAMSLDSLMLGAGFVEEEFDLLAEAHRRSDRLVEMEEIAMNAIKGKFQDDSGAFSIAREPDRGLALQILFGPEYHQAKKEIMDPINDFLIAAESRTARVLENAREEDRLFSLRLFYLFCALGVAIPAFLFTGYRYYGLSHQGVRESEERYRSLVSILTSVVWRTDADGQFVSPQDMFEEFTGQAWEDHKGWGWANMIHPDDRDTVKELWMEAVKSKSEYHSHGRMMKANGEYCIFDAVAAPIIGEQGKVKEWVGTITDVTDRKRAEDDRLFLERQVQHTQKLESLGVLAGGIAHDFNNILMTVLGNADLALDQLGPHAPARENIIQIESAAKRAAGLANQMLAYSGKGKFVVEAIDLGLFIAEMVHLLEVAISKKIVLEFHFADDLPTFGGDATQIRQVILNLITNASEAIGDVDGVITVSTGARQCDRAFLDAVDTFGRVGTDESLPEGNYVFLEVTDTGCGMDDQTLSRIFEPFFTTKFTGRGLGLSAMLGIVQGHNASLKIDSDVGHGTSFKIFFPAGEPSESGVSRAEGKVEIADWHGAGTVLIVDDEESIRSVGKNMLESFGFDVLTAEDGLKAIEVFRENESEIVCVLLDLTMPHMDGTEAFHEMLNIRNDARIILCSGYNMQDTTQRFAGSGLAGFLHKPYSMAELREILRETLPAKG